MDVPNQASASIQALVQSLKTIPEARLRLVELAWRCVGDNGELDMEKAAGWMKEIEEAIQQANAYTSATEKVRWALAGRR